MQCCFVVGTSGMASFGEDGREGGLPNFDLKRAERLKADVCFGAASMIG
jgi:hypothetical protein